LGGFQRVLHFGNQKERERVLFRERKNGYCLEQRIVFYFLEKSGIEK
jgi:hypothetical protein